MPFLAITEMLKRHFGVADQDSEGEVIAKVRRGLERMGTDATQVEPALRYLLSVDPGDAA